MTRQALYSPLRLQPRSSRYLALFLFLAHGMAAVTLFVVPLPLWLKPALLIALAGSLQWSYRMQVSRSAHGAIVQAVWDGEGVWEITLRSGQQLEAVLLPDSFVTLPLVVLNFSTGRWRRRSLVLTQDNTASELLRKLRVRLRLEYQDENRRPGEA